MQRLKYFRSSIQQYVWLFSWYHHLGRYLKGPRKIALSGVCNDAKQPLDGRGTAREVWSYCILTWDLARFLELLVVPEGRL